jgi:DNA-binding transcriptional ArsR family regulator
MVERLDSIFSALSDPTRREMLVMLGKGEVSIGELGKPYAMTFAGAAKHVGVLERAGLIERRKVGRQQLCRLRTEPLRDADAWLRQWEQVWSASLDSLERLIAEDQGKAPKTGEAG